MFYGGHHDLGNRYIISISLMTTYMFYGSHHHLGNRYIVYISLMNTICSTVEHICGHK
jgi:hypothetical protein